MNLSIRISIKLFQCAVTLTINQLFSAIKLLSLGAECNMEYIFRMSYILQLISLEMSEIIAKYEKQGKYLPILHKTKCDNYFIAKCFLKSNLLNTM